MLERIRRGAVRRGQSSFPEPHWFCPPCRPPRYNIFAAVRLQRMEGVKDQNCILARVSEKLLFRLPTLRKRVHVDPS